MFGQYKRKKSPSRPQAEVYFIHDDFTESGQAKLRAAISEATGEKLYPEAILDFHSRIGDVTIQEGGKKKIWEWEQRE